MPQLPHIIITTGEPAGIGPDVLLKVIAQPFPAKMTVIADQYLLAERAKLLGLSIQKPNHLSIIHVPLVNPCIPGKLDKANASYVIETLSLAGKICLEKPHTALVTGPVHKAIINEANIKFTGHTEFLADLSHTKEVVMMLMAKKLRVALATTHLPLKEVANAITPFKLEKTIRILNQFLIEHFKVKQPKIFVAGLNPHAGEDGKLGREEIEIIIPTLEKLRQEGMTLFGPFPADTLFLQKNLEKADAFLAMYHDQGLPVLKFYDFDNAINVTLGLPFIRTSVDHGTALDLAGTNQASEKSLAAAISAAITLSQ